MHNDLPPYVHRKLAKGKAYHRRFEYAKVRREWYDRVPELMAEITRLQREERNKNVKTLRKHPQKLAEIRLSRITSR